MKTSIVVVGGGGHARVLLELLSRCKTTVLGLTDVKKPDVLPEDVPYLGNDAEILHLDPERIQLANGLGSSASTAKHRRIYESFIEKGFRFASLIHPFAVLSTQDLHLGQGVQVMAGAVINPYSHIGDNVLINTRAVVEHDCRIGDHAHVATGAIVCGGCRIGTDVHIGAGATIIQGIEVGYGAVIAAGTVVVSDVKPMTLVAGVPAKEKRNLHDN